MATRSMPERDAAFERRCPPWPAVPASAATASVARTRSMRMPPTSVDLRTSQPATGIPKPCVHRRAGPAAGRAGCPRPIAVRRRAPGSRSSDPAGTPADRASVMPGEVNTSSSWRSAIAERSRAAITWGRSSCRLAAFGHGSACLPSGHGGPARRRPTAVMRSHTVAQRAAQQGLPSPRSDPDRRAARRWMTTPVQRAPNRAFVLSPEPAVAPVSVDAEQFDVVLATSCRKIPPVERQHCTKGYVDVFDDVA